ncbi:hypothetical protein NKH18_40105 [Streptomyces sp. M10(2022)]
MDLFDAASAEGLVERLVHLLDVVLASPDVSTHRVDVLVGMSVGGCWGVE